MADVGMLGKEAPVGHNLAGVDVPVGVGLGMVDTPSISVDTEVADMVYLVEHLHSAVDMAHFVQDAHKVAEVSAVEGLDSGPGYFVSGYSGPGYSVPGFEVEDSQPAREVVVCFVPVGSEECCYEPVDYPQWSHHNIED